jgi:hypothetical protein
MVVFGNAKPWPEAPEHGETRPGIVLPTPAHLVHVGILITGNLLWATDSLSLSFATTPPLVTLTCRRSERTNQEDKLASIFL